MSLGSNRLPPDSTLLTALPGYEPELEQMDMGRPLRERSRERDNREYGRDQRDRAWDRERYYAGNGRDNGGDQQYKYNVRLYFCLTLVRAIAVVTCRHLLSGSLVGPTS